MRPIGSLLIACVALAIIRAAVVVLLLTLIIALVWSLCRHPRAVTGFLTYCAFLTMLSTHPLACLIVIGAAIICAQMPRTVDESG